MSKSLFVDWGIKLRMILVLLGALPVKPNDNYVDGKVYVGMTPSGQRLAAMRKDQTITFFSLGINGLDEKSICTLEAHLEINSFVMKSWPGEFSANNCIYAYSFGPLVDLEDCYKSVRKQMVNASF